MRPLLGVVGAIMLCASSARAQRPKPKPPNAAASADWATDMPPHRDNDPVAVAIDQTYRPETRAAAIATLEASWSQAGEPRMARLALARALSWEGHLQQALSHYDGLLAEARDVEIELARLEVLGWLGRSSEAETGYHRLIVAHPANATAHARLARIWRWQGRPLAALASARRAVELSPDDTGARDELALAYVALGLPDAARGAAPRNAALGAEARAAVARADQVSIASSTVAVTDSFGIERLSPRIRAAWSHAPDVRVQLGGGSTHIRGGGNDVDYGIVGLRIAKAMPRLELALGAAAFAGSGLLLGEIAASAELRAHDALKILVSGRRRPLLEVTEPLATTDIAFFATSAGATMPAAVARRGVDELRLAANAAPLRALYLYVDGRAMQLSDSNRGYTIASGAGLDVLQLAGIPRRFGLVARIDSFATGFDHTRPDYFSPARFHSELIGAQAVVKTDRASLAAYGGANVSLGSSSSGWTAGGALDATFRSVTVQARGERRDDLAYSTVRAWLAMALAW